MEFYFKYVLPQEKLIIEKNKQNDTIILDKEILNIIEEKKNFPKELPKKINLSELMKYYAIKWKRNGKNNFQRYKYLFNNEYKDVLLLFIYKKSCLFYFNWLRK